MLCRHPEVVDEAFGHGISTELNGEYSSPHLSAHTVTDRRIIRHQMAVNGPQTPCLICASTSPQALHNQTVRFTLVHVCVNVLYVYT